MARVISLFHLPATADGVTLTPRRFWRRLRSVLLDRYRPERHYMRGPGPKWREKHCG